MDCAEEIASLKRELGPVVGGDDKLEFDLLNGKMTISPDANPVSDERIARAVALTGMKAAPWHAHAAASARLQGRPWWKRSIRGVLCGASGVLVCLGFVSHALTRGWINALAGGEAGSLPPAPALAAYLAATVAGGWFIFPKAAYAARRLRPDMNLLMTIAVIGAALLGEWFEAATVTFLFAFALLLESWSVDRARHAIRSLMELSPAKARVRCGHEGSLEERPIEEVAPGAIVVVRPGERIPLDGVVCSGSTTINQAPITGESREVVKGEGDSVFAGTINNEGSIEFRVTREASDTTLARIIRMVEEAQGRRARSEQWVERFARYYTPAMMALAAGIAVVPPLFVGDWNQWFYEALVLLVIACPCALVISTPVSIVAGLAAAARMGVLIKGGLFLESAARIRAVALDKTGTLTTGRPEVQHVVPLNDHSPTELLERAAAIEVHSEHPIAHAIVKHAIQHHVSITRAENFISLRGRGAEATWNGRPFWLGSHRMLHELAVNDAEFHESASKLEDEGHSLVVVGNDDHICGFISLADSVRPGARAALSALKSAGVSHVRMLTGDNEGTAQAVARATGVDAYEAELMPEDKVTAVGALVREFEHVAMVGDGVNDAPAMAAASLGIAMGAAGSDAAIETADVALMSDDLSKLPWLIGHARRTLRTIKQNIAFALGVKAIFVALALLGHATLWMAIAADMGASLLVIFNALRLLQTKELAQRTW